MVPSYPQYRRHCLIVHFTNPGPAEAHRLDRHSNRGMLPLIDYTGAALARCLEDVLRHHGKGAGMHEQGRACENRTQ